MELQELIELCDGRSISETVLEVESQTLKTSAQNILHMMEERYDIMALSARQEMTSTVPSVSGLSGYNTKILMDAPPPHLLGAVGHNAMVTALAVSEQNARMGKVVAAPTAGACGILPGVVLNVANGHRISKEKQVMALITAAKEGEIIAENATVSGAVNALMAASLALAGIKSVIPADEVINAMKQVESMMSCALRETAKGGIAATNTAKKIQEKFM